MNPEKPVCLFTISKEPSEINSSGFVKMFKFDERLDGEALC